MEWERRMIKQISGDNLELRHKRLLSIRDKPEKFSDFSVS